MRPIAVTLNSLFAALLLMTAATAAEQNPARTHSGPVAGQPSAQRIIVKFRPSTSLATLASKSGESAASAATADTSRMNALANRARFTVRGSKALGGDMHVMQISAATAGETADQTLGRVRADSDVEFAVPDRRVYLHADANDPRYLLNSASDSGQWYLRDVQKSAINARGAWDITKGSNGVVVAVVDTGVLYNHEDLGVAGSPAGGKLLPGFDFISPDQNNVFNTAGDGNGYDNDPTDPGDFCGANDTSSWHGTRVSGIIAAQTNNNVGVSGINWNGYILPVRVIGRCGGVNSDVVAGIRWAAGLPVPNAPANPYPAQVINVSLGGTGACDPASAAAIGAATNAGALVVVSAGNEGGPVDSPANCPGAMAILGLRHSGTKVGFSSLGAEIALGAPGGNCVNDIQSNPSLPCVYSIDTTSNSGATTAGANVYTDKNSANTNVGTSFSSPIVSGIAGLMLSVNGNLKSRQLIARMREGASPYPTTSDTAGTVPNCVSPGSLPPGTVQGQECICNTAVCGAGMANALGAVQAALRPIAAVSFPGTFASGSNVTLNGSGSGAACHHTVTTYSWSVNGTVVATSPTYAAAGNQTVRLTVTDDAGKTDSADVVLTATSASSTAPTAAGTKACLADITPPVITTVTISATDTTVAEAGADAGTFTITRTGSTSGDLTVNLVYTGTATSGADYTALSPTVTIPNGSASAVVTVTPVDDTAVEGAETVVATLQAGTGYQVGTPAAATLTIVDNDTTPAPPVNEGNKGGGGGGALDWLTLVLAFGFAIKEALNRRAAGMRRRS